MGSDSRPEPRLFFLQDGVQDRATLKARPPPFKRGEQYHGQFGAWESSRRHEKNERGD
jgi:hypothetical protein